jgi:hypothetical protein
MKDISQNSVSDKPPAAAVRRCELEKAMGETVAQLRGYRAALKLRKDELLAGPHGREMQELLAIVDDPSAAPALLVDRIASAAWLRNATTDFRHVVLAILSDAIRNRNWRHVA